MAMVSSPACAARLVQVANCEKLVKYLEAHPLVKRVNYPGSSSSDPKGHAIQMRQALNGGSLLSFTTGDIEVSRRIVEDTKLFKASPIRCATPAHLGCNLVPPLPHIQSLTSCMMLSPDSIASDARPAIACINVWATPAGKAWRRYTFYVHLF